MNIPAATSQRASLRRLGEIASFPMPMRSAWLLFKVSHLVIGHLLSEPILYMEMMQ
ncbi:hypothetical protein [Rhizobium sp. NZLR3b]|uniref:hypothetical protein n=1 Tax=Rhizobium sp. NZLR3b TaxID=2731101 RepID=UPI002180D933|nr:hypothetical protein [Rhizobium sp. NZLR3b]